MYQPLGGDDVALIPTWRRPLLSAFYFPERVNWAARQRVWNIINIWQVPCAVCRSSLLSSSTQWPPMSIQRAAKNPPTTDHCECNADDTRRLLLRNSLQQQKSVRNHAEMQLQQNAQQTWLQVSQTIVNIIGVFCRIFFIQGPRYTSGGPRYTHRGHGTSKSPIPRYA